jgi:hypothetical protein
MVDQQRSGKAGPASRGQGMQQQAAQLKEQAQEQATQLKDHVAEGATSRLEGGKAAASGELNAVAHAIRKTSGQLREADQGGVAAYFDGAARQIEQVAGYLDRRDVRGLVRDAEGYARREPALFLGGAVALGLLTARFLRSSGAAAQDGQGNGRYGPAPALATVPAPRAPAPYPVSAPAIGRGTGAPTTGMAPPAVDTGGTLRPSLVLGTAADSGAANQGRGAR